jgi:pyruvate dehydrogenase E1 component alpha subunit
MASPKISPEQATKWLESMLLMRRFEEKCAQLYGQQKIKGFCHLYIGQEAVVAGTYSAITPQDSVVTAYRDHGHALACGLTPGSVMAELYGKATGCSKGKGGSMHLFSKEHRFFGGHGIVGGQIPLGAGIAFAEKYLDTNKVNICFMGDGAVRQGALHETFNMAMLWKLPVVFVIENNGYAMGTSVERTTNVLELYQIGSSYQMPSEAVDGMNVLTVHEAMERAVARARSGEGPTLLEIRTYRFRGHSMSDPAKYRTKEEVEAYREQDPIEQLKKWMTDQQLLDQTAYDALEERIETQVQEAVDFAENSPWPEEAEMFRDVYLQADYPYITD